MHVVSVYISFLLILILFKFRFSIIVQSGSSLVVSFLIFFFLASPCVYPTCTVVKCTFVTKVAIVAKVNIVAAVTLVATVTALLCLNI